MSKIILNDISLLSLFEDITENEFIQKLVFSKSLNKEVLKKEGKLFKSNDEIFLQMEKRTADNKIFHENILKEDIKTNLLNVIKNEFLRLNIITNICDYQIISKSGEFVVIKNKLKNKVNENPLINEHNRKKNYIFPENIKTDFLYELGIMNENGKVFSKQYDKFKQINKYLEYIKNLLPKLAKINEEKSVIKITDLCCGKGYLTFAVYSYLTNICNLNVECTGVDLKSDVVSLCNDTAKKLNFDKLKFICEDVNIFEDFLDTALVISLHACNTLTDVVLGKAILNNVQIILSSPCCHNELSSSYKNNDFSFITKYPIMKERFCEILTDSIRSNILKAYSYDVSVSEFISIENTGKNVLIQGVLPSNTTIKNDEELEEIRILCKSFSYDSTLLKYLN